MSALSRPIQRFYDSAARHSDAVAVADAASGDLTYAELRARVDAFAVALQAIEPMPGSRVGICARNTREHVIALLATYAAGKVWVPLSPRNGRTELDAMIAVTRPSIVVTECASIEKFTPISAPLVLLDTSDDYTGPRNAAATLPDLLSRYAGRTPRSVARTERDAQIIKFSGGSTGTPKPVVQSVRCLNAQADGIRDFFDFSAIDVNLIAAPLTHGASCFVLPILERGGRHVLVADAKPATVLDAITRHAVTTMYAPPTLLYALIDATRNLDETQRARLFSSLTHVIYSAAPMTPARIRECQRVFGPVIETAYGQVEAPQIVTAMRAHELLDEANLTSVGRPTPIATVAILHADSSLAPANDVGEIVVRGPLVMSGYLDRDDETAATIKDGWLHTGDLGMLDDRGYLFIRGRLREVINSGGFKIFPGDIDTRLGQHAAVAECAAFGMPDPTWGEAVHAAVVVHDGAHASEHELIAFVKSELGSVKAPKRIWFVTQLERNAAGKVSRAGVRAHCLQLSH